LKYIEHEQHFLVILNEPVFEIIDVLKIMMLTIRELCSSDQNILVWVP